MARPVQGERLDLFHLAGEVEMPSADESVQLTFPQEEENMRHWRGDQSKSHEDLSHCSLNGSLRP